jgi:hypothetical protein
MFSDSVDANVELLRELISGLPPERRRQAKKAGMAMEKTWNDLIKDNPKNPAVALGAAFVIYLLAQRLGEAPEQGGGQDKQLIQLLS